MKKQQIITNYYFPKTKELRKFYGKYRKVINVKMCLIINYKKYIFQFLSCYFIWIYFVTLYKEIKCVNFANICFKYLSNNKDWYWEAKST